MGISRLLPIVALLAGQVAAAEGTDDLLPTRSGESGYLDLPVAESLGKSGAAFLLDLRIMRAADVGRSVGPSPFTMSFGMGRAEAGFSLRQGGLPGDPRPSSTIPAGAGKLSILESQGWRPALAADLLLDRINRTPAVHLRAVASSRRVGRLLITGVGGYVLDTDRSSGWTAGGALSLLGPKRTDLAVEILRQPAGLLAGAGLRWRASSHFAFGLGVSYLPSDARTLLAGVTINFLSPPPPKPAKVTEQGKEPEEVTKVKTGKRRFTSDRPRFPLELRQRPGPGEAGGPAPHYPGNVPVPNLGSPPAAERADAGAPGPDPDAGSHVGSVDAGPSTSLEPPPVRAAVPDAGPDASAVGPFKAHGADGGSE